jgi:hypothetical protein
LDEFGLAYVAVVSGGLNYAVGLSLLFAVLAVIVAIGINFWFIMGVAEALKKVMNPVWLGKAQEKQKQRT